MKIVHVTNAGGFGRTQMGGAERAVAELSTALANDYGWEEHVIAPPEFFSASTIGEGVTTHPLELDEFSLRRARGSSGGLRSKLKEISPDVTMAHLLRGTLVGLPAAASVTTSLRISVLHASLSDYRTASIRQRLRLAANRAAFRRVAKRYADLNIAVSEDNHKDLVEIDGLAPRSVQTIHNWASPEFNLEARSRRAAVRAAMGVRPEDRLVLAVGRLEPEKNQGFLIELLAAAPSLTLAIAGAGALHDHYEQAASAAGVAERVRLLGFRRDVPQLLAAADVVAVPSLFEAFGRTVVEALAVGTPVVTNSLPAITEILDRAPAGAGRQVPLRDRDGWRAALEHDDEHSSAELAAYAREHFSLERAAATYDQALRRLTREKDSGNA